jgi:O-acetyl-ADP-ribose deacetylase (regulator of RNase III)
VIGLGTGVHDFTIRLVMEGGGKTIEFVGPADLTSETSDAIVNAANSSLLGGGGVDGAIHRAGGPEILEQCRQIVGKIGSLPAGKAVITTGGRLAAKFVIHTVGPIYRDGKHGEAETLASCHRQSIRLADERRLRSVSFPAISTGAYGYPAAEAAEVAVSSAAELLLSARHVERVRFVLFDGRILKAFTHAAEQFSRSHSQSHFHVEKGYS